MRRREFIKLIGGVALSGSNAAIAQPAITVVGLLSSRTLDDSELAAIRDGLNEFGYVAGRTVEIEYRSADSNFNRLPTLAAELVRRPVSIIIAVGGTASAEAAKAATTTIPIVFANGSDPVKLGLVASLNIRNDALHLAAGYAGRILKGEKPADLPVQQATKVELVINLKTAKTLGITIPLSLLGRADEVIE